jgi:RHS repeat-associated protein
MTMKIQFHSIGGTIIGETTTGSPRVDYLTDALGSVTATVNQSAQVVNTYRYKPYGTTLAKTGPGSDPAFGWVGEHGYEPTGNPFSDFYVMFRHYDKLNGKWPTVDPIGFPDGWNPYRYVKNSPTIFIDPSGLVCIAGGGPCQPGGYDYGECIGMCDLLHWKMEGCDISTPEVGNTSGKCTCCHTVFKNLDKNTKYRASGSCLSYGGGELLGMCATMCGHSDSHSKTQRSWPKSCNIAWYGSGVGRLECYCCTTFSFTA